MKPMFRIMGSVACFCVALDCIEKAAGWTPDPLLPVTWPWWFIAFAWGCTSIQFAVCK